MNWKLYRVNYYMPSNPHFGGRPPFDFNYFKIEALNAKDALRMARADYLKAQENSVRNLPDIKLMKFVAINISHRSRI